MNLGKVPAAITIIRNLLVASSNLAPPIYFKVSVKLFYLTIATALLVTCFGGLPAKATVQTYITGQDAAEVQENAFKANMDYPVGPLRCSQRCSQLWERN